MGTKSDALLTQSQATDAKLPLHVLEHSQHVPKASIYTHTYTNECLQYVKTWCAWTSSMVRRMWILPTKFSVAQNSIKQFVPFILRILRHGLLTPMMSPKDRKCKSTDILCLQYTAADGANLPVMAKIVFMHVKVLPHILRPAHGVQTPQVQATLRTLCLVLIKSQ